MNPKTWGHVWFWVIWIAASAAAWKLIDGGVSVWIILPGQILVGAASVGLRVAEFRCGLEAGEKIWRPARHLDSGGVR